MFLEKGFSLEKYEIEKLLGKGGMGEVYLANDTELNRSVAIKFLSNDFSSDEKLRNRFIHEVRSVSALNHPHILTVFEFGKLETEEKPLHYFVSEYVEGETLRSYIEKEKLILGDILDIIIQIASSLTSAHEAGIIHRDIKPENIMIRRDGYAKILDFGLAKTIEKDSSIDLEANTKKVLTNPGTVMGTVNYMSPEQAKGESVDARTDIWSLGVLFYETITGKLPFEGETTSHTIVSILEKEPPPLSEYIQPVPESFQFIINELLVKDRTERCQSAKELHNKLKRLKQQIDTEAELDRSVSPNILRSTNDEIQESQKPQMTIANVNTTADVSTNNSRNVSSAEFIFNKVKKNKKGVIIAAIIGLFAITVIAFATYKLFDNSSTQTAETPKPIKLAKLTNDGQSFSPAISPDGKHIAYIYENSGKRSLRLRQTSTSSHIDLIPEIKGTFLNAEFSPNGNDLYFVSGEKGKSLKSLYKISILGGEPKKLFDDVDSSVSFSPDGERIVFLRVIPKEKKNTLVVANTDGTNQETIIEKELSTRITRSRWSPDGKSIAFVLYGQDEKGYFVFIDSYELENKKESRITADRWRNIMDFVWLDNNAILLAARDFASAPASPHQIWKIPSSKSNAIKITNDLNNYVTLGIEKNSEKLITQISNYNLSLWVTSETEKDKAKQITTKSLTSRILTWTPDKKIIYTSNEGGNNDLWIINSDGEDKRQLTSDEAFEDFQMATADGKYIVYETNRKVGWSIWRMNSDGSNQTELLGNIGRSFLQVTPDSQNIIYAKNNSSLWKLSIDGGKPVKILDDRIFGHKISPDGKQIAYLTRSSDINSSSLIKIIPIDGGEPVKVLESPFRTRTFEWSPDGKALDFLKTEKQISNIWRFTLEENSEPEQISDLKLKGVSGFKRLPNSNQLAITNGERNSNLVLIENFK